MRAAERRPALRDEADQHAEDDTEVDQVWVDSAAVDVFFDTNKHAIVTGGLLSTDVHTGEQTVFEGRNCGMACDAIWPNYKEGSPHTEEMGNYKETEHVRGSRSDHYETQKVQTKIGLEANTNGRKRLGGVRID